MRRRSKGFLALRGVDLQAVAFFDDADFVDEIGAAVEQVEQVLIDGVDLAADVVEIHGVGGVQASLAESIRFVFGGGGGAADGAEGELLFGIGGWFRVFGIGKFHFAEFGGVRQIVDGADAEVFEKQIGGFIKQRPAGKFGAAADADQVAIEQFLDHAVAGHAADGFDGGFGDGLAVGDDGEGFHGGAAHALRLAAREKLADEIAVFDAGVEFPAFRAFQDGECALAFLIGYDSVGAMASATCSGGGGGECGEPIRQRREFPCLPRFRESGYPPPRPRGHGPTARFPRRREGSARR